MSWHTIDVDHGIAAQSIMLGAVEQGLGGCMIASIKRKQLRQALDVPERYEVLLVLALGKPQEEVVVEDVDPEGGRPLLSGRGGGSPRAQTYVGRVDFENLC